MKGAGESRHRHPQSQLASQLPTQKEDWSTLRKKVLVLRPCSNDRKKQGEVRNRWGSTNGYCGVYYQRIKD